MAQSQKELDNELSWTRSGAATTPIYFPDVPGEVNRLNEKANWLQSQAIINASLAISEFELKMLINFEMLKWLGCEFLNPELRG